MKNQNDLIIMIVAAVISIGCCIAFAVQPPKTQAMPTVTPVPLEPLTVDGTQSRVVMADALPGGTSNGGFGAGAAAGGRGGAPAGFGGPAGGGQGRPSEAGGLEAPGGPTSIGR